MFFLVLFDIWLYFSRSFMIKRLEISIEKSTVGKLSIAKLQVKKVIGSVLYGLSLLLMFVYDLEKRKDPCVHSLA